MNKTLKLKFILSLLSLSLAIIPIFSNAEEPCEEELSPETMQKVKTAIQEYFKTELEENFQIKPLTGGYSATSIRIDFLCKSYVL